MVSTKHRIMSVLLALCMAAALFAGLGLALPLQTKAVVGIGDPVATGGFVPAVGSTVYFGHYPQSQITDLSGLTPNDYVTATAKMDTNGTPAFTAGSPYHFKIEPIAWRVLDNKNGELFLLSEKNIDSGRRFDPGTWNDVWTDAEIYKWLNSANPGTGFADAGFKARAFTAAEANAVTTVTFLDIAEATTAAYGFTGDANRTSTRVATNTAYLAAVTTNAMSTGFASNAGPWWLRSPGNNSEIAVVMHNGEVDVYTGNVTDDDVGIRPAIKISLNSVLFASAASGTTAKSSVSVSDGLVGASAPTGAVKLTVKDSLTELRAAHIANTTVTAGDTVPITYLGTTAGKANTFISCVLTDSTGNVLYYGKLEDVSIAIPSSNTSLKLPASLATGSYTVRLFTEVTAGDNLTDFASAPTDIVLNVTALPTPTPDHTATQTPGTLGPGTDAVFVFNGEYVHFSGATVIHQDGTTYSLILGVDSGGTRDLSYDNTSAGKAESSSVKITLYAAWLDTLPAGTYTLMVDFDDSTVQSSGSADFVLTRAADTTPTTTASPQTGDNSNIPLWALCGTVALAGLALCGLSMHKRLRSKAG